MNSCIKLLCTWLFSLHSSVMGRKEKQLQTAKSPGLGTDFQSSYLHPSRIGQPTELRLSPLTLPVRPVAPHHPKG